MKRRLICLFMAVVLSISLININVFADENNQDADTNRLVIGVEAIPGFAYSELYLENVYSGYMIDYLSQFNDFANLNLDVVVLDSDELIYALERGNVDLIITSDSRIANSDRYVRTNKKLVTENSILYAKVEADYFTNDFEHFEGMRIGFPNNTILESEMQEFAQLNGFNYVAINYPSAEECIQAINEGEVDGIVLGNLYIVDATVKNVASFGGHTYSIIGLKDKQDIIENMDVMLSSFVVDYRNTLMTYYSQHYWESRSNYPSISREDYNYYQSLGTINVGYIKNMYPYEYTNNGEIAGVTKGFFDFCEQYTGAKFSYVEFANSDSLKKALNLNEVDLIASVPSFEEITKNSNFVISRTYVDAPLYRVFSDENEGNVVAYSSVFLSDRYNSDNQLYEYVLYNSAEECLDAVLNGHADFTYLDEYSWFYYCDIAKYSILKVERVNGLSLQYSVAAYSTEKGRRLIELINNTINVMPREMNQEILSTAMIFSESNVPIIQKFVATYKYHMGFLLLVLVALIVISLVARKKNKDKLLEQLAYTDNVTGKPNYQKFIREVEGKIKTTDVGFAIGYFNISNFKYINDFYGRDVGDNVLRTISGMLDDLVAPDGMAARWTSDRFVFYVDCLDYETLKYKIHTYLSEVEINAPGFADSIILKDTCGVYIPLKNELSIQDMIDRASIAEKMARDVNNDSIMLYTEEVEAKFMLNQEMTAMMDKSLANGEFKVYLQPKVDILTERPIGAEALVRWISPEKGFMPVGDFISLFEKNGFITEVDFFMLEKVCEYIRNRINKGLPVYPININQSRLHINDSMYLSKLHNMLNKYDIPMNMIVFEITESAFIENANTMIALINRMKGAGFEFSMDDFGSGYSSLNLLKDMPVDELKIDKGFLDSTEDSEKGRYIIEQIINMAHGLDIRVVCEGVERVEQVEFLRNIGCDIIQGYYYSKPMPMEDFEKYVAQFEA